MRRGAAAAAARRGEGTARAVMRALWHEILNDHVLMVAAGLAYHAAFGPLPALTRSRPPRRSEISSGAPTPWGVRWGTATGCCPRTRPRCRGSS